MKEELKEIVKRFDSILSDLDGKRKDHKQIEAEVAKLLKYIEESEPIKTVIEKQK